MDDHAAGAAVAIAPERTVSTCPMPARRLSLSVLASLALHGAAAAAFVWLGFKAPAPISAGEEGIAVEMVVAADTGSASQQDAASGKEQAVNPAIAGEVRQAVEAPPAETPPEMAALDPAPEPTEEPPVAQPDPLTMAERLVDQLPPPPMPESLAAAERPVDPSPVERAVLPVPEQAVPPQQPVLSPPAPALHPAPPPPAVRREAVRQPPTRREAAVTRDQTRPIRQAVATPQPDRTAPAVRQAQPSAARAEQGEGAGQRNRQQSDANGAAGAATTAAVAAWRQRVLAHLARFKVYPDQARDAGIHGRAAVAFTLSANGAVSSVSIATSSGAAVLDQATLAMVRRAQPFPPNPAGSPASFTAGINYSLY